jgi:hypothetical protein
MNRDLLVTTESNVEDQDVVVEILLAGWDGEVGSWLSP